MGGGKDGVYFIPDINIGDIPWDIYAAHEGFDGAFTPPRAHDPENERHIQLDGNEAYFYGYDGYGGKSWSDYLYYKETDSTEKTFQFSMMFSIYPASGGTERIAQRWHSLYSVGFLVNCVENEDDGTISGYYVSFEPIRGGDGIVLRMLERVNFDTLYDNSQLIMSTPVLETMLLDDSTATYLYEIKSSHEAFSITKDGEDLFSLDLATADASKIPLGYTGGNDFGFYAGYIGSQGGHTCSELSFAEFKNIWLSTKSLVPDISDVSWNNGNGNGNGGGINQLTVNGIVLKSSKNYVAPENFEAVIAKTTLAKNDPTAIYTVVERNADGDGQYEKVYAMKIALFEDGAWKVYKGRLVVDNPGRNDEVQIVT
ncbi:MAG: hypothetical protein LBH79_07370 [Nitrososphaerota archaeon]|jgi:hypothetical protein|nr:hypothetical protein [Nitrososphaerota archaeon]